ncbi:hypothetical protein BAE44_0015207 [Dichanthelium oligosanthes]|uniref:Uncharacterized protein n=1 Tax=Dichanthelium oligosanthes TaxID=888268 RepID=A0A1E5VFG5_9POAL|nr:hypothetical protein BAE44_0015207 [Dichanthelium oligosanthes]
MLYTTKGYCHFLSGDDDAIDALDEEYVSKARMNGEATVATIRSLEKEVLELEAEVNKLTSGPSRQETLEAEKETLTADVNKFEAVVKTWKTKIDEREEALVDLEKELEAKVLDARRTAADNQDLLKKVDAQAVNFTLVLFCCWHAPLFVLIAVLLKPGIDFQYKINSKGSSPAEVVGPGYKTVLKPALMAHAEENKRIAVANLGESVDLQKQLQGNAKSLDEERNNISSLQAQYDEMVAWLNALDREITSDDSRCTADTGRKKDELEKKSNMLSSVEKEADEFLKNSEKRLQDAILKDDEETQAAANELLQLVDSIAEHKEFMEATIAQRRKDLYEAADYIASLASIMSSPSPPNNN